MSPRLTGHTTPRLLIGTLLLAILAASGMPRLSHAATAPTTQSALRTITITASHPSFPKRISAGLLALHVVDDEKTGFDIGVARPNRGISLAQAEAASARQGFMQLARLVTFLGGIGVPAGRAGTVVLDLRTPGQYGLHVTRGDQDPGHDLFVTVTPSRPESASPPQAAIVVTLAGTRFLGLPKTLAAGATTFKVASRGPGIRDMLLYRLDPGKTVRDMIVAMNDDARTGKDPTWAHSAGNMDVLSSHQVAWLTLTLAPGSYVALCPLPDPTKSGTAYAQEGMIAPFTVS